MNKPNALRGLILGIGALIIVSLMLYLFFLQGRQPDSLDNVPDGAVSESTANPDLSLPGSNPSDESPDERSLCEIKDYISSKDLKSTRRILVRAYFGRLLEEHSDRSQLGLLAEKAGVVDEVDSLLRSASPMTQGADADLMAWLSERSNEAPLEKILRLMEIVGNDEVSHIRTLFGDDSDQFRYGGMPLFTAVLNKHEAPDQFLLDSLYAQGFEPDVLDAFYGVMLLQGKKVDHHLVTSLIEHLRIEEDAPEDANGNSVNELAFVYLQAAEQLAHPVLEALLNRFGVASLGDVRIFDKLPGPEADRLQEGIKTVELLLDHGLRPQTRLGVSRLRSWLPEDWLQANEYRIAMPEVFLDPGMEVHLEELGAIKDRFSEQMARAQAIEKTCPGLLVQDPGLAVAPAALGFEERQALFHSSFAGPADSDSDILGQFIRAPVKGDLATLKLQFLDHDAARDLDEIMKLLPDFFGTELEEGALYMAFSTGISAGASMDYFETLMAHGAVVPEGAIISIAIGGHERLLEELAPHGLDIHFARPKGMNALSWLAQNSFKSASDYGTFLSLLEAGVDVSPPNASLDPLNLALMKIPENDGAMFYIVALAGRGAPVTLSHRQQMAVLKMQDKERYQEVIELVPQLAVDF